MQLNGTYTTSTMHELRALFKANYNLTDAHPRYRPVDSQYRILERANLIFLEALSQPYDQIAQRYQETFFTLARQPSAMDMQLDEAMLCYSASLCIQIIASYLRNKSLKVALMEPAFDNVVGILRAERINLVPLPENQITAIDSYLDTTGANVVWITIPNNPTGFVLSEDQFRELAEICSKRGVMLVVDFCFRFYCQELMWDQYALLKKSGVTYATIEDTGKTWSTLDLKVGTLQSSPDIYQGLYYYYDNHLLNMSPFIMSLLTELIRDTLERGLENTVYKIVNINRGLVTEGIKDTILQYTPRHASMPVVWLQIIDSKVNANQLQKVCEQAGVHILPGSNFFWHNPELGSQYVRISLVRDPSIVKGGVEKLREVLTNHLQR